MKISTHRLALTGLVSSVGLMVCSAFLFYRRFRRHHANVKPPVIIPPSNWGEFYRTFRFPACSPLLTSSHGEWDVEFVESAYPSCVARFVRRNNNTTGNPENMTIVLIAEEIESTLHDVLQRIRESFDSKCVLKDDSTTNLVTIEPSTGQNAIVVDTLYGQTRGIVVAWQMLSCQTNNSSTQFFDIVTREAVPWFRRQWGTCVNFQTNKHKGSSIRHYHHPSGASFMVPWECARLTEKGSHKKKPVVDSTSDYVVQTPTLRVRAQTITTTSSPTAVVVPPRFGGEYAFVFESAG
eukprot:PhF_6_TR6033/c0_g2_i3/m.8707